MGRHKTSKKLVKEHIGRDELLGLLKSGIGLTMMLAFPNSQKIFKPLLSGQNTWNEYYPSSIHRHTMKLWRKGLVDVRESSDGYTVVITEKGRRDTLQYDLEAMTVETPTEWDGRWRMIFFDIPTTHKARNHFREKLLYMGFFCMQKSVYVYPYPCEKQIKFLREVYEMPHSVKYAVVESLENDEDLRRYFHVRR